MTSLFAGLLLFAAAVAGQDAVPGQAEISQEINRELRTGNWNVLLKYHWLQLLVDRADTADERRRGEDSLEAFRREGSEAAAKLTVISVSAPRVTCSFASGEYAVYLEEFSLELKNQGGSSTVAFELVYASHGDRWFVFLNDERLEANLTLSELAQMQPRGTGEDVKPPECLGRLHIRRDP